MPHRVLRGDDTAAAPASRLTNQIGIGIIGLLMSLVGTGIVSTISLYTTQAALTAQVHQTSEQLARHLDHAVDKDDYLRRDKEIQAAIEKMASKEELRAVKESLDSQTQMLRDLQQTLEQLPARSASRR